MLDTSGQILVVLNSFIPIKSGDYSARLLYNHARPSGSPKQAQYLDTWKAMDSLGFDITRDSSGMSVEVESNPFRPDGELSKEAEDIIKNSTILRDKVIINDPSMRRPENGVPQSPESPLKAESVLRGNESAPLCEGSPIRTGEVVSGQVPFLAAEETAASTDGVQPILQVEHVKIKSGPANCCLIL
ncbi:hypothetical protein TcWFU_001772 [Taenia crassiceps]|uniref:Uncharacterized protein n=1 Tax=Taenia crassiceps TaxID=6207 RepID=A0ABR4QCU3_9CEST